ncbi:MAG: peptidoglycan DD-metalloendopeptidase family protein [Solirubrobacterales bacterium]
MDKFKQKKLTNFIKKEGFYVVLFVCLCIVATVAAVTVKNNKDIKTAQLQQNKLAEASKDNSAGNYQDALQVKDNAETAGKTQKVNASTETKLIKPVEGTMARTYSENPVYWESTKSYRSNLGYEIKTALGKPVVAVMDGKVESIDTASAEGVKIVISHENGIKTVYSNLDAKVKVTQGQSVKQGTEIGTVGKTSLNSAYESYGDHLHFAVIKGNDYVDPGRYIKY